MIRAIILVSLLLIQVKPLHAEDDWLTELERDFFHELGCHVFISGKNYSVAYSLRRIESIGKASAEPLRGQILDFVKARRDVSQANDQYRNAGSAYLDGLREINPKLPKDPKQRQGADYEKQFVDLLSKNAHVKKAWIIEHDRLAKGLAALDIDHASLNAILTRIGKRLPAETDISPSFRMVAQPAAVVGGDHLWIECTPGEAFSEGAVIQIVTHQKPTNGAWNATILHKNLSLWWIGNDLAQRAQENDADIGMALTQLQEQAKNRPVVRTFLVPPMNKRDELRYDLMLPAAISHYLDRVELRCWCKTGVYTIKSVDGLAKARLRTSEAAADRLLSARERASDHVVPDTVKPPGSTAGPFRRDPQVQPGRGRVRQPGNMKVPPMKEPPDLELKHFGKIIEPKEGRSLPKPEGSVNLLYPGSLWKGIQFGAQGKNDVPIELELNQAILGAGAIGKFRGDVPQMTATPFATALVACTPNGDVTIIFKNRQLRSSLYEYHGRLSNETVIEGDVKLEGRSMYRFKLEYVPPK